MAFIDELSRRLTQTSENAMQKTRQMAEVGRLESAIKQELQKMNDAYFQLGKAYVGLHPIDYEDDLAYLVTAITDSEQKVTSLRQQVREIKGITVCANCGAEVPVNTVFCSTCGTPMPRTAYNADTENKVRCTKCGNYVPKNMRFCTSCGGPMMPLPQAQPDPVVQSPSMQGQPIIPTEPAIMPEDGRFGIRSCSYCGAQIEDAQALFCTGCGMPL